MLCVVATYLGRVYQSSFDHETSQGMGDEDDRPLGRFAYASVGSQLGNEMLGMVVYLVPGDPVGEGCDVCIVPVHQYARLLFFNDGW